jgi:general secretion pathway protein N
MTGLRPALLLAAAGFLLAMLATLPLRWLVPLLPATLECAAPTGSVWSGQCAALRLGPNALGTTTWSLRPLELLRGRLGADLSIQQPGLSLRAIVAVSPAGTLTARDLRGDVELGYAFVERLAPNLRGRLALDLSEVVLRDRWVRALRGDIVVDGLQQTYPQALPLGSYRIQFAAPPDAAGRLVGQLQDTGGPLDVAGTLALLAERGYELTGSVATRADAPQTLVDQIRFLGSPDAAGRRQFAQSETF